VLERIAIQDFAVAREVVLELRPGVTVFTGETGAGKSLIVDALAFAFGGRKGREVIASGASRARIELTLQAGGSSTLIERSISNTGRSSARIDGTVATIDQLQQLGARLADIHGQSDQLSVLKSVVQRELLDQFAGLDGLREEVGRSVRELRETRRAIHALTVDARERERRLDQLRFEVEETDAAGLTPGEDESLRREHQRLANSRALIEASERALAALDAGGIPEVVAAIADLYGRDESADDLSSLGANLEAVGEEMTRELRRYHDAIEEDPERLVAVEERLDLLARLRRKYGDTIEAILAYRDQAASELAGLERNDLSIDELRGKEADLRSVIATEAGELSSRRRIAARELVGRVGNELEALGMAGGALAIGFEVLDDPDGIPLVVPDFERVDASWEPAALDDEPAPREVNESGADRLEFLASFNPGQDPRPLASIASGGETSRFLLALAIVFGDAAEPRTVVLDEVDEGVGGRAGSLVGQALRRLAERHQVLCITHLPQVAAYGDHHLVVRKHTDGKATWSLVEAVDGIQRIDELATMLGGLSDAACQTASELLHAASRSAPARA
jgi:DNA repair protein RecN (Recombination protein N)